MKADRREDVKRLTIELPPNLRALSPLVRNSRDGVAVMEFAAVKDGTAEARLLVDGNLVGTKSISAGTHQPRAIQPERVSGYWPSWLWPVEPRFDASSPIGSCALTYPDREIGFLPGGAGGVLLTFFVSSILFGLAVLKPLNIQI